MVEERKELMKIQIEKDEEINVVDNKINPLLTTLIDNNNLQPNINYIELKRNKKKLNINKRKYTGLISAITAGVFMTLSMIFVKILNNNYHAYNLSMWRYAGTNVLVLPLILYFQYWKKSSPFSSLWSTTKSNKNNWMTIFWLWLSCSTGSSTFILRYLSLNYLTVADSTVIAYSGPVIVVFLAHFFLNEKCGIVSILIALWTFLGVFAISRPPILTGQSEFSSDALIGTSIALAGMILGSICIIFLRKVREVQFSVVVLSFGIWGTLHSGVMAYFTGVLEIPHELHHVWLMIGMSTLSFLGGLCVTLAVKFEQAGPYALIRSSDILFAFIWQFIFLNVKPDLASIIGAVIVMTGILITTFRKWITILPDDSSTKNMFSFLLH